MKLVRAIILLVVVTQLTGCADLAGALWLESYRIKGGYYDRHQYKSQKSKP